MHDAVNFKCKEYQALKKMSSIGNYSTVSGWCRFKIKFLTKFRRIKSTVKIEASSKGFSISVQNSCQQQSTIGVF